MPPPDNVDDVLSEPAVVSQFSRGVTLEVVDDVSFVLPGMDMENV